MKIRRIVHLAAAVAAALLAASAAAGRDPFQGTFTVAPSEDSTDRVELHVEQRSPGHHMSSSFDVGREELRGYSSDAEGPVRFELVRDAGTLRCEGVLRRGAGGGSATLLPNDEYVSEMTRLGYLVPEDRLLALFLHDVSRTFVRDLASLGYPHLDLEDLIRLRIHGATAAFIRELQALGYSHVGVEDLVRLRIHGATPEFVRRLRDEGVSSLSVEDLVRLRIHGATPEFVHEVRALGYEKLDAEDLVRMRIHGVTPEYIRSFVDAGYERLSIEDLVRMKIHGVTPALARAARGRS